MCEWIHQYIQTAHENAMHNDITHHGTFYSVVQAVMYILAFRQKEFLDMEKGTSLFLLTHFHIVNNYNVINNLPNFHFVNSYRFILNI